MHRAFLQVCRDVYHCHYYDLESERWDFLIEFVALALAEQEEAQASAVLPE